MPYTAHPLIFLLNLLVVTKVKGCQCKLYYRCNFTGRGDHLTLVKSCQFAALSRKQNFRGHPTDR